MEMAQPVMRFKVIRILTTALQPKHATDARLDAQELLALVVQLSAELAKLRKELPTSRAEIREVARLANQSVSSFVRRCGFRAS